MSVQFNTQNLSEKNIRQFSFNTFLGIDKYNNSLNVSKQRSPESINTIFKNGSVRKRNGFTQRTKIKIDGEYKSIKGYFEMIDSNGFEHNIICCDGNIIQYHFGNGTFNDYYHDSFKIINSTNTYSHGYSSLSAINNKINQAIGNIANLKKVYGKIDKDRIFILTGKGYLVYGIWEIIESISEANYSTEMEGFSPSKVYKIYSGDSYYYKKNNVIKNYYDLWQLRLVSNNEDTFIPITTIGITTKHSNINVRTSLNEVNLLSRYRYNKLIGVKNDEPEELIKTEYRIFPESQTDPYDYNYIIRELSFIPKAIKLSFYGTFETSVGSEFRHVDYSDSKYTHNGTFHIRFSNEITEENKELLIGNVDDLFEKFSFSISQNNNKTYLIEMRYTFKTTVVGARGEYNYSDYSASVKIYQNEDFGHENIYLLDSTNGIKENSVALTNSDTNTEYIENIDYEVNYVDGTIKLKGNKDFSPFIVGQSNLVAKFIPNYSDDEFEIQESKINNCTICETFGYNEAQYLFISGNENYPNFDWHNSEISYNVNEPMQVLNFTDYTYFGDLNYTKIGDNNNKIVGYSILGDNTMAVLKTTSINNSCAMYIRNSYVDNLVNGSGDIVYNYNGEPYKKVYFNILESSVKSGCLSGNTINVLGNDKIFLSNEGIVAITLTSNIKSTERILKERSRLINNDLLNEPNLDTAVSIVYDNRYYLLVNNHIYIMDARFRTEPNAEMDDTFSYECWKWEISHYNDFKINFFFVKENKLWFATDKGELCYFEEDTFEDKMFFTTMATFYNRQNPDCSEIEFQSPNNNFEVHSVGIYDNGNINGNIGEDNYIYQDLFTLIHDNGVYNINQSDINNIFRYVEDKILYYGNNFDECRIVIDDINNQLKLYNINGVQITNAGNTKLYMRLQGEYGAYFKDTGAIRIYQLNGVDFMKLVTRSNVYNIKLKINYNKNVFSSWQTPIIDLGIPNYKKTINSLTIIPTIANNGQIKIGYLTRQQFNVVETKTLNIQGINKYDLSNLTMNSFSVDYSNFNRVYTKKLKIRDFTLIQFVFTSDSNADCAINEFLITYYITKQNKGVN